MAVKHSCAYCGAADLSKNTLGINKKLYGKAAERFLCMECLAEELGVTVEELLEKIEEFKDEGCELFE